MALLELHVTEITKPYSRAHSPERHSDATIMLVLRGDLLSWTRDQNRSTLVNTPKGGLAFVPSMYLHTDGPGGDGVTFLNVRFTARDFDYEAPTDKVAHPEPLYFPDLPELHGKHKIMMMEGSIVGMKKFALFTCECLHKLHADDDHEVLFYVEKITKGSLLLLPDKEPLEEGTLMFWPLGHAHGVAAAESGTQARCLVIEFWK